MPEHMKFPILIVCPKCGVPLASSDRCGCDAQTRLADWEGIPRTLFGQDYWGESSRDKMVRALQLMDQMQWKEALSREMGDDPVHRHLTTQVGPDVVYQFPWNDIGSVLD